MYTCLQSNTYTHTLPTLLLHGLSHSNNQTPKVIYFIVFPFSLFLFPSLFLLLSHANLCRYFSLAGIIRMHRMLSIDACQSSILSSPTFNLPSCCAANPVSCHFLRSSDCSLKAPSLGDKEEGNRHCPPQIHCFPMTTDTPPPHPSTQIPPAPN